MASSTARAVFERSTDAFNRHDLEGFKANLADDASCTAPGGVHLQGKDAVAGFYEGWMKGFPDAHVDVREAHYMDDCIVEEGVFTGTHQGVLRTPGGDIPPTGRCFSGRYVEVIRIRGEHMQSMDLYFDRLELLEQLGLAGSPSAGDGRRDTAPASAAAPH